MVIAPRPFYGRDHSGDNRCDGLFATANETLVYSGKHFRRSRSVADVRSWLEVERKRFQGL